MDPHVDDGQLNALLDGELDAAERGAVEAHLTACAECRGRYEEARRFLSQASDLLGLLDAPVVRPAAAPSPAAAAAGDRRVAPTAKEPAVVLPGPGIAKTAKERAVDPSRPPVARTAQEHAIEVPSPTAEVPALPPEEPAGAARPIFGQVKRGTDDARPRQRLWGIPPLAWAAMLVVGIGAGWLARGAMQAPRREFDLASGPAPLDTDATAAAGQPATAAPAAPAARRTVRTPLVKPRTMRGTKEPTADQAAARIPLDRPAGAPRRSDELAAAPAAGNAGAGVRSAEPAAGAVGGVATRQPPATGGPGAAEARASRAAQAAPAATAPAAFQRIPLEEAVRRLSESIRLIDGMQPGVVEVGPGRLVAGASPDHDVVRVHYRDDAGRPLVLDQQPGEAPAAESVNGLMRGDTLVTQQPDGTTRVRWVDRKSFWLSLTGSGGPDSVRMLVERIR